MIFVSNWEQFLGNLFEYIQHHQKLLQNSGIYIILGGILFYLFSVILWSFEMRGEEKTGWDLNNNWIYPKMKISQFLFIHLTLIALSFISGIIAVGISVCYVLESGRIIKSLGVMENSPKERIFSYFGKFLNPILWILVIITGSVYLILGEKLRSELLTGTFTGILYLILTKKHFLRKIRMHISSSIITNKRRRLLKVAMVLGIGILLFAPIFLFGIAPALLQNRALYLSNLGAWKETYWVEMPDGVRLSTRVYYPEEYNPNNPDPSNDGYAVILYRTPYNSESEHVVENYVQSHVKNNGYVLIMQDLRGAHDAEGNFQVFISDRIDGNATINWIVEQTWSNGSIATVGASADCTNQYYYHQEGPEGLKAAFLHMGASDLYDYWMYPGGCYRWGINSWWIPAVSGEEIWMPHFEHPEKDEYWKSTSLSMTDQLERINLRGVHIGGWFDVFQQGTLSGFQQYNEQASDYAKNHQILIIGPWGHNYDSTHNGGNITYPNGNKGVEKAQEMRKKLFEEALKGQEVEWDNLPRVHYYVMGDPSDPGSNTTHNHWRTADMWPLQNTTKTNWYFHPNGTLSPQKPINEKIHSFLYDPGNPVPTYGGNTLTTQNDGQYDQSEIEGGRSDILRYESPVLQEAVEIIGRINATLEIKSNCTDTDYTVKLMDRYPDGREMYVASGILKTRYRSGFGPNDVQLMSPGARYQLTIDMWSSAYHFVPGHQIIVSISSSNYPEFALNPNTGGEVRPYLTGYEQTTPVFGDDYYIANNSLICGTDGDQSFLSFPQNI